MHTMTNHAQEAERIISTVPIGDTVDQAYAYAQVHATLALVERQRIANLIALGILGEHSILTEQVSEDAAISLVEHKEHIMGGYFQLAPEIAAALGIEQDS